MLASILGARLSLHLADGWVFEPFLVGPDIAEYTLKEGPHAGRHAIQHVYYQHSRLRCGRARGICAMP